MTIINKDLAIVKNNIFLEKNIHVNIKKKIFYLLSYAIVQFVFQLNSKTKLIQIFFF